MSANKKRYYKVTTTQYVTANNQAEALAKVNRKRADATILSTDHEIERVPAAEYRSTLEVLTA